MDIGGEGLWWLYASVHRVRYVTLWNLFQLISWTIFDLEPVASGTRLKGLGTDQNWIPPKKMDGYIFLVTKHWSSKSQNLTLNILLTDENILNHKSSWVVARMCLCVLFSTWYFHDIVHSIREIPYVYIYIWVGITNHTIGVWGVWGSGDRTHLHYII